MRLAFVFAGQGAEEARMGLAFAARSTAARALFAQASDAVGVDLARGLERGGRWLARTSALQPAIVAAQLAALGALEEAGVRPVVCAGHSLGELAAVCAAGAVTPPRAVDLAVARGRAMEQSAGEFPGGMLAMVHADAAAVARAVQHGAVHGRLVVAGRNAPDEWMLAGDAAALDAVLAAHADARRIAARGPWHTDAMAGARAVFASELARVAMAPLAVPWVSGVTAAPADDADVAALLARALVEPVRWHDAMTRVAASGIDAVVVVGPSKVLRGLARRNLPSVTAVHAIDDPRALDALHAALGR